MSDRPIILVNTKGTSAKVWGYDSFRNVDTGEMQVIWFWGTAGKYMHELQKKTTMYPTWYDAYDAVRNRIDDKTRSGYIIVERGEYFKAVQDFRERLQQIMVPKEVLDDEKEGLLSKMQGLFNGRSKERA